MVVVHGPCALIRRRVYSSGLMSFRPARFTDIHRAGPPTTDDGLAWTVRLSAQPPDEWLAHFQNDVPGEKVAGDVRWAVNVRSVDLRFVSSPDNLRHAIEHLDERIRRANEAYRRWLDEAHRQSNARRHDEHAEAERIRSLNERFKNL